MNSLAAASLSSKRRNISALRARTILTLFSGKDDLDSHRVRIVLAAKGIPHELVVIDPQQPPDELKQFNPYANVPTLVDRELAIYEVDVLCEYLDERYPHPALLPMDPHARARVRLSVKRIEREWLQLVDPILTGTKAQAEAGRKKLKDGLLSAVPVFKASKYFLNPDMSVADCALAALIWRLPMLGVNLGKEGQAISDYGDRFFRNPAYNRSMTETERMMRPPL